MVHALKEIWRVLIPGQSLIDLRPLGGQSRVEVMAGSQLQFAGLVDESADQQDDLAADNAIAQAVVEGWFSQVRKTFFEYATYWDTPNEMKAYAEARWTKSHLPEPVLARTRQLIATSTPPVKLRIRRKMMIARYRKQSL
jgi:hypothetical protein